MADKKTGVPNKKISNSTKPLKAPNYSAKAYIDKQGLLFIKRLNQNGRLFRKIFEQNKDLFVSFSEQINTFATKINLSIRDYSDVFSYFQTKTTKDLKKAAKSARSVLLKLLNWSMLNSYLTIFQNIESFSEVLGELRTSGMISKFSDKLKNGLTGLAGEDELILRLVKLSSSLLKYNELLERSVLPIKDRMMLIRLTQLLDVNDLKTYKGIIKQYSKLNLSILLRKRFEDLILEVLGKTLSLYKLLQSRLVALNVARMKTPLYLTLKGVKIYHNLILLVSYLSLNFMKLNQAMGYLKSAEGINNLTKNYKLSQNSLLNIGYTLQEQVLLQTILNSKAGTTLLLNKKTANSVGLIALAYGMSFDLASNLMFTMSNITSKSIQSNDSIYRMVDSLAKANKMSSSLVFKLMAANSLYSAKFTKLNALNIALATVYAKKLGIGLSDVQKVAESALDFLNSITKLLLARLITGQNIQYNRVRLLAVMGKHKLMMLLLKNILMTTDTSNMFDKQALSDLSGLSILTLARILTQSRALQGISMDYDGLTRAILKNGMTAKLVLDAWGSQAKFAILYKKQVELLKISLMYLAQIALPAITWGLKAVTTVLSNPVWRTTIAIGAGFLLLGTALIKATAIVKGVLMVFNLLSPATAVLGKSFATSSKFIASGITNIGTSLATIPVPQLLATTAAFIGLAGGVWILSKAASLFAKAGVVGTALMVVSLAALTGATIAFSALSVTGVGWAGIALLAALSTSMIGLGYASNLFAKSISIITESISKFVPSITTLSSLGVSAGLGIAGIGISLLSVIPALTAFAAASVLFNGPVQKFANSMDKLSNSYTKLQNVDVNKVSSNLNKLNLEDTNISMNQLNNNKASNNENKTNNSLNKIVEAINTLIKLIQSSSLKNINLVVNLDGKKMTQQIVKVSTL